MSLNTMLNAKKNLVSHSFPLNNEKPWNYIVELKSYRGLVFPDGSQTCTQNLKQVPGTHGKFICRQTQCKKKSRVVEAEIQ